MKKLKTAIIALLLIASTTLFLSSCEEEQVLPSSDTTISPSGDGTGMEDEKQFD